jgi:phosphoenolpyruvate synthase/pyruvate phosphate dikinase
MASPLSDAPFAPGLVSGREALADVRPEEVGGKAWNLFRLREAGFAVPPWIVVTASGVEPLMRPARARLLGLLREGTPDETAAEEIQELLPSVAWPGERELRRRVEAEWGGRVRLAVRSSVVGEDSREHSYAGLMETRLNVAAEDLGEAVRAVCASAFSARALLYRRRKGIALSGIATAVIVQELVPAAAAGVAFSREPETGDRRAVITAGYGLGEGVVSDRVEVDTYRIGWRSDRVERQVVAKESRVSPAGTGGTRVERVPRRRRRGAVLHEAEVRRLRDIVVGLERVLGGPQDVEWARDGDGRLWLLQARPIVSIGRAAGARRIWDNANIVESYPGLTLPLTFSFARHAYETAFRRAARGFLVDRRDWRAKEALCARLIGLLRGRVYYNLLNWYALLSSLPGFERHRADWDAMLGITERAQAAAPRIRWVNRLSAAARLVQILALGGRQARRFFAAFGRIEEVHGRLAEEAGTAEELADGFEALSTDAGSIWHLTLYNELRAMVFYGVLQRLCRRWLPASGNLHDRLLAGEEGVESVAPLRSLDGLARLVRQRLPYRRLFETETDDRRLWTRLEDDAALGGLRDAFVLHLERYGDRSLEELKLESSTFREEPALVVRLVRERLDPPTGPGRPDLEIRRAAEQEVRAGLRGPLRRRIVTLVLGAAREGLRSRENMRFARTRLFGMVRRVFRRLGTMLAEAGLLEEERDVHCLTFEEVLGVVRGTGASLDLKAVVRLRRAEYEGFAGESPADRLETRGLPARAPLPASKAVEPGQRAARGVGCSSGRVEGRACVVRAPRDAHVGPDDVLVARSTDPGWVFLMVRARGIVVERGSVLSHTAIIGRELGIPTVVGLRGATALIPEGCRLTIDGETGEVSWR